MQFELLIQNGDKIYQPMVLDGVQWTTERRGVPSQLKFAVHIDEGIDFTEGNAVRLTVDGQPIFYGFVFSKRRDKQPTVTVTAYDQMRYLKNKDSYNFSYKTASDVIKMIASDFQLQTGTIADTDYVIESMVEDNSTLFDIIYQALDLELTNRKQHYVFYDNFGKLCLKSLEQMKINLLIDAETGENFDYTSSIDKGTYNKIKLAYKNPDTGMRDIYIAQDGQHIRDWGVLQYYGTLKKGEQGDAKADALLSLYNSKTRQLKITKAIGDTRVRAGTMPVIHLALGEVTLKNYMLVEKAVHSFNESEHWMNLTLRGGEFIG